MRFDGTSSVLISTDSVLITSPVTIFAVVKDNGTTGGGIGGIFSHAGISTPGPGLISGSGSYWLDGSGANIGTTATSSSSITTFRVVTATYTGNSTSGTSLYFDGVLEANYTGGGQNIAPGSAAVQIGGRTWNGWTNRLFKGDVGELLIYNRLLAASERGQIESYLKSKWGL